MILESRIVFWQQFLNWLLLPSLTGYGALQNISPFPGYVKEKGKVHGVRLVNNAERNISKVL